MTCAKGLHPEVPPDQFCRQCKRAYDRAYYQSERGKESHRKAQAKYYVESKTGFQKNKDLLTNRRYKALRARERREHGPLPSEGRYGHSLEQDSPEDHG